MIDDFLFCDWDEPPRAMDFELSYGEVLDRLPRLAEALGAAGPEGRREPGNWARAVELYLLAPALVNVILNYRVCVDLGLPLHPTVYFETDSAERGAVAYPPERSAEALRLFGAAIDLARAAYRLDPALAGSIQAFRAGLPEGLEDFVYTSHPDKYTWRGADPEKVRALAASVLKAGRPELALGAAHGSLMAGLLLAELLQCRLWFLRFSMFKRKDREPVFCAGDEAFLRSFSGGGRLLVFDEDSASGTTLAALLGRVRSLAPEARSGAVIRHASSAFLPDHVGKTWWD